MTKNSYKMNENNTLDIIFLNRLRIDVRTILKYLHFTGHKYTV